MLPSDSLANFSKIDDYFINSEPIGKDSFGPIYFGFCEKTKKPLTIKIMSLTFINGRADGEKIRMIEIVKKEIKILTRLKECQNIVQLIDYRITTSNIYLFFEYFSLDSSEKPLLLQLPNFLRQISESIRNFIKHHLIHRDLTPSNIFIKKCGKIGSQNDDSLIFQVGGFGMARFRDRKHLDQRYLSPEVLEGESLSEKSDVWAMGTILDEKTFGGRLAWEEKEKEEIKEIITFILEKNDRKIEDRVEDEIIKNKILKQGEEEDKIEKEGRDIEMFENVKERFFNLKNAVFVTPTKSQSRKLVEMLKGMLEKDVEKRLGWEEVLVKIKEFLEEE